MPAQRAHSYTSTLGRHPVEREEGRPEGSPRSAQRCGDCGGLGAAGSALQALPLGHTCWRGTGTVSLLLCARARKCCEDPRTSGKQGGIIMSFSELRCLEKTGSWGAGRKSALVTWETECRRAACYPPGWPRLGRPQPPQGKLDLGCDTAPGVGVGLAQRLGGRVRPDGTAGDRSGVPSPQGREAGGRGQRWLAPEWQARVGGHGT